MKCCIMCMYNLIWKPTTEIMQGKELEQKYDAKSLLDENLINMNGADESRNRFHVSKYHLYCVADIMVLFCRLNTTKTWRNSANLVFVLPHSSSHEKWREEIQ